MQNKWYFVGLGLSLLLLAGCASLMPAPTPTEAAVPTAMPPTAPAATPVPTLTEMPVATAAPTTAPVGTAVATATPLPSGVDGWKGTVIKLPPGNQFGQYFQREDGQRFGIGTTDDALHELIHAASYSGQAIRVWGELQTGVPATESRYIDVQRVEVLVDEPVEPRSLSPWASVSASSYLPADRWGQYGPLLAIDGLSETSWVEGVAGPGIGEWLTLSFRGKVEVHSVALNVGYDADADLFAKNNRIKKVTLLFSTGESVSLSFADQRGLQSVALARAPGPNIETTFVKLVIDEVYPGSAYDDTCLAEIEVWGRTLAD